MGSDPNITYRVITYVAPPEMPKLGSRSVMPTSTPKSSRSMAYV